MVNINMISIRKTKHYAIASKPSINHGGHTKNKWEKRVPNGLVRGDPWRLLGLQVVNDPCFASAQHEDPLQFVENVCRSMGKLWETHGNDVQIAKCIQMCIFPHLC